MRPGSTEDALAPAGVSSREWWWLAALAITSLALIASSVFTYRNAAVFAEERLVRVGLAYALALGSGMRRQGPRFVETFDELARDATNDEVVGVALVSPAGEVVAHAGRELTDSAERRRTQQWTMSSGEVGTLDRGAEGFSVTVPLFVGCRGPRPRPPWLRRRGRPPRHFAGGPPPPHERCDAPTAVLEVTLDPTEARRPLAQARMQMGVLAALLLLAWALAWRWRRANAKAVALERRATQREKLAMLGEMGAVMAHEIRNPLGAIRGHAQLLESRLPEEDERGRSSLSTVIRETARLDALVGGLLRYARPQPPSKRRGGLGQAFASALDVMRQEASAAGITLDRTELPEELGETPCDSGQIEQVLLNLLRNAVQCQEQGGRVRVSAAQRGARVELRVEDAGPGVPVEDRERVFVPFVTGRAEGSGLGLAIARQLVESHGGSLRVDTSELGGAAFVMELPLGEGDR